MLSAPHTGENTLASSRRRTDGRIPPTQRKRLGGNVGWTPWSLMYRLSSSGMRIGMTLGDLDSPLAGLTHSVRSCRTYGR